MRGAPISQQVTTLVAPSSHNSAALILFFFFPFEVSTPPLVIVFFFCPFGFSTSKRDPLAAEMDDVKSKLIVLNLSP